MTSPLSALPAPPAAPGSGTQQYGYGQFGPDNGQFMTIPQDGSTSTGTVDDWRGWNPLSWFEKQVTYFNEVRYFNTFRSERSPQRDRRTETTTRSGEFRTRRDGGMCWREERVTTSAHVDMAYTEYQRYELWSINETQMNYYDFVTGMGGVAVDASIDLPAAAASHTAGRAAAAAAAEGVAVSAGAARLAIASRALGTVGLTYLMFQVFTGAWVAYSGSTRNAAGDMLSEGWELIRHYFADGYDEDPVDSWEAVEEPHPCSDTEKTETGYIPSGFSEWARQAARSGKVRVFTVLLCTGAIIGLGAPLLEDDQAPVIAIATATTSATVTPSTTATATATRVAIDAMAPQGMVVIFRLDGVDYLTNGLIHMGPHAPNCTYEHVHGGQIRSLIAGPNGQPMTRTEHLGDCGFGPPSFYMVRDPR